MKYILLKFEFNYQLIKRGDFSGYRFVIQDSRNRHISFSDQSGFSEIGQRRTGDAYHTDGSSHCSYDGDPTDQYSVPDCKIGVPAILSQR